MSATGDPRQPGDPRQQGFTLIELLVVIAVAGIVARLMFPSIDRAIAGLQFGAATSTVAGSLRSARAQAIRAGTKVDVAIADGGRSLSMSGGAPVVVPGSVTLVGGAAAIAFFGDGSATGGAIDVRGASRRARVSVEAATGRVRLADAPGA
jgi:general secretion pathway protein H